MRVHVDLADRPGGPFLLVSASGTLAEQPVRWTAGRRLLVARNEPIGDEEASELADAVDRGGASAAAGRTLRRTAVRGRLRHRHLAAARRRGSRPAVS